MTDKVALYQHPVPDIALDLAIPPPRPRSVLDVMDGPQAQKTECGYDRKVTDVADWPPGAYFDPWAENCKNGCKI